MKTMKKMLIICCVFTLCLNSIYVFAEDMEYDFYMKKLQEQEDALSAYQQLSTLFVYTEYGITYPEDYCGTWIENNKLFIALTSDSSISSYREVISPYDEYVIFTTFPYSLGQLESIMMVVVNYLRNYYPEIDISAYYCDERNNKIIIETLTDPEECADLFLTNEVEEDLSLEEIDINNILSFSKGDINHLEAALYGGREILSISSAATLGVCGTVSIGGTNYQGFVTAGHIGVSTSGDSSKIYINNESNQVGTVVAKQYSNNQAGDFCLVKKVTTNYTVTNRVYGPSNATFPITNVQTNAPIGALVMKYGKVNGYAYGYVTATQVSVQDQNNYMISGLTRVKLSYGDSSQGDSGGPFYTSNSTGYTFVGVLSGSTHISGEHYVNFTPYSYFSSYFTPYQTTP